MARRTDTPRRILDTALASFATRGYEATSLDALAGELGVTKQTILHHFGSKEGVLDAVLNQVVAELAAVIEEGRQVPGDGWRRVEGIVKAVFRLAGRKPELLAFVREISRLGPRLRRQLLDATQPLLDQATAYVELATGQVNRPGDVVLSAYAAVLGTATEVDVLREIGITPSARLLVRRRRMLLDDLAIALGRDRHRSKGR